MNMKTILEVKNLSKVYISGAKELKVLYDVSFKIGEVESMAIVGPSGSGKHSSVMSFLEKKASSEAPPKDWCYVNNFKDPRKPIAIELPFKEGFKFKNDIDELIELLKVLLPSVFEENTYRDEREAINQKYVDQKASIFKHLEEEAKKHDISLNASSKSRITFTPIVNGKILS